MDSQSFIERISVNDVVKRRNPKPKFYVYVIEVFWRNPENVFVIYRRYREFFDLQCKLLDLCAKLPHSEKHNRKLPYLPGKILFGPSQKLRIAQERRQALDVYCKELIKLPTEISRSRIVLEFFQARSTDVLNQKEKAAVSPKAEENRNEISQPLVLPNYRCISDFKPVEKSELSMKKDAIVQLVRKNENGWWLVRMGEETGFVPGAFLQPAEQFVERSTIRTNETFVVNKSYRAANVDEISLDQGSFVTVLEKSFTGWWRVQFNQLVGEFPAVFLTSCRDRPVPQTIKTNPTEPKTQTYLQPNFPSETRNSEKSPDSTSDDDSDLEENQKVETEIFFVQTDFVDPENQYPSLKRGERLEIYEKHESGWWLGRQLDDNSEHFNWFPSSFLGKNLIEETAAAPIRQDEETKSPDETENCAVRFSVVDRIKMFERK